MMKSLQSIIASVEKLEADTAAWLNVLSKGERDSRTRALKERIIVSGVAPSFEGLNMYQMAATKAFWRAIADDDPRVRDLFQSGRWPSFDLPPLERRTS